MDTGFRRQLAAFAAVALAALVASFWTSSDPAFSKAALAADPDTSVMGAAREQPSVSGAGEWERFHLEKQSAPVAELPAQF
jgi:hypothetical protein